MGIEKNIVAVELGSSAIRAMIGQKLSDGSLHILGYEKETAPDSIQKGVVYNIDKTIQAIAAVIKRIEERQKVFVNKVYVGVNGQSLRTVGNTIRRQLDVKVAISEEIIDSINDENRNQQYAGSEILDVVPQEYRVGSHLTTAPVGIMSDRIEGCYKNVVARRELCDNIRRCLQGAKLDEAGVYITPLLLSGYLLSDPEKRSGCALVDFGAQTTTVAVYEKNILRHLAVIPIGGDTITNDIAALLHIEHDEAEALKRTYGTAFVADDEADNQRKISLSNDRHVDENRLKAIIEARQQEILANVWAQVKDYADRLLSGLIFTGGGANMKNMDVALAQFYGFDKVKTRILPVTPDYSTNLKLDAQANTLATLIAMLRRGEEECTDEKPAEPDLFEGKQKEDPTFEGTPSVGGDGVVKGNKTTEPEAAATTPDNVASPEVEKITEPAAPKKPNAFKRFWQSMIDRAGTLVNEDN